MVREGEMNLLYSLVGPTTDVWHIFYYIAVIFLLIAWLLVCFNNSLQKYFYKDDDCKTCQNVKHLVTEKGFTYTKLKTVTAF